MAEPLDAVPNGADVLIDANVLIYALNGQSAHCKTFLERCSREEITGIVLYEVLNDATHRFMAAEAVHKGLCANRPTPYLTDHPETVKLLTDYWANTQRILALNLLFIPLELDIIQKAQPERVAAGLLTNDSMIVATMRVYGIQNLATADDGFNVVAQITVFSPTDLP